MAKTLPPPPFCQIEIGRDGGPGVGGGTENGLYAGIMQGFGGAPLPLFTGSDTGGNRFFPDADGARPVPSSLNREPRRGLPPSSPSLGCAGGGSGIELGRGWNGMPTGGRRRNVRRTPDAKP